MQRNAETCAHRAFTLIELMVVVAIIAVLIAILVPSLAWAREQAMQVKCAANLNSIVKGMFYYMSDGSNGNGYLPQLGWDQRIEGGFWANQIHRYVKIRRSRAGAKNGLLVCPADPNQRYRYIDGGPNSGPIPGTVASEQEKRLADLGQSSGARRRSGGVSGSIGTGRPGRLIEPVSYTGSCDTILAGPRGYSPRKWTSLERPHCFVLITETKRSDDRTAQCFRWSDLLSEAQTHMDYKRHYGGEGPARNGSNFLFGDGHVQWHSALYASTRMICCMDFGVPVGFTGPTPNPLRNAGGAIALQTQTCTEARNTLNGAVTRRR